jgi:signal transduction histidine kinase
MININRHRFIFFFYLIGWTIISFGLFWWSINGENSVKRVDELILLHGTLWLFGLLFSIPFISLYRNEKRKVEKLLYNQKNYYSLFNSFSTPAFLYEKNSDRIVKLNKAAKNYFNVKVQENNSIEIEGFNCLSEQLKQFKNSRISNVKLDKTCFDIDNKEVLFEVLMHDIYMNNSLVTLIILHDKTEHSKEMEEINEYIEDLHAKEDVLEDNAFELIKLNIKLEESENNLREANANKDKFFSIVAHDLKSPFVGLLGITEMLDLDYNDFEEQERRELIHSLYDISKNTFELLEGLLDWARAKQGRMDYNPKEFDLFKLSDSLVNLLKANAFKKDVTIKNSILVSSNVFGDREMVSTVIRNLLANAIKFTPKNGVIEITSEIENDLMKVSVIDSGVGISEENVDKLFRIDVNHTTLGTNSEKGTGLGLILCKELIEKHGTNIWVESKLDEGSKFHFTLPLSKVLV